MQAQTTIAAGDSIHAAKTLFTTRDILLAAGYTGLTIAMFPADRAIARRLQDSTTQASRALKNASVAVQYFADPGSLVLSASLYGVGRIGHWKGVADLGLHSTEAIVISGLVTGFIKDAAGRARPYVAGDTNAHDFGFGRGLTKGGGYQSFPSGHATVAFAAASVVTSETQRSHPKAAWVVGTVMYSVATLVGVSRVYNNAHWASDVAGGAAIGTFSGLKVVRYSHGHTNNPIDRWLLGAEVMPAPDGRLAIGWSMKE